MKERSAPLHSDFYMVLGVADNLVTDFVYIFSMIELVSFLFLQHTPELVEQKFNLYDIFVFLGVFDIIVFRLDFRVIQIRAPGPSEEKPALSIDIKEQRLFKMIDSFKKEPAAWA